MAIYPRGTRFMVSVGSGESRTRKTFKTLGEAQAWEQAQSTPTGPFRGLPGHPVLPADGWTLRDAFDHACKRVWKPELGGSRKARCNAELALDFFGSDTPLKAITTKWVRQWVEQLQDDHMNSGSTCNRKLSALSLMLKEAQDADELDAMPRIKRCRESDHRIVWFTDEDEAQMVGTARHLGLAELADLIVVGLDTGMRRSELLRLDMADYVGGNLILHADDTKNGRARTVTATDRVAAILAQRSEGRVFAGLTESALRKRWDDLRVQLKREDDDAFIVHTLRHTCATRLVAAGTPLADVKEWMGHSSIAVTMRYAHMTPGRMTEAAAKLNARQPA